MESILYTGHNETPRPWEVFAMKPALQDVTFLYSSASPVAVAQCSRMYVLLILLAKWQF